MNHHQLEKAYAALLLDPDFNRLELLRERPNIFSALRVVHYENRHSNFLGWLMDPGQSHGLGAKFLKWVLSDIFQDERVKSVSVGDIARLNFNKATVYREWNRIDLLIEVEDVVVAFENKVHSGEHSDQLKRYRELIEEHFNRHRHAFVFLSPGGGSSSMHDTYVNYAYSRIITLLERLLEVYQGQIRAAVIIYIEDYIETIKTHFMSTGETNILARKIYGNHKALFDFIFSQSPNPLKEVYDYLHGKLSENGWVKCYSDRNFLRFLTPKLHPVLPNNSKSWKGESFLFEFNVWGDGFSFYYTIAPGNEETRTKLSTALEKLDGNEKQEENGGYYVFAHREVDTEPIRLQLNDKRFLDEHLAGFWEHVYSAVNAAEKVLLEEYGS